jgi:ubiquinone/menaquinone biosynthesis C-methylase UbiE
MLAAVAASVNDVNDRLMNASLASRLDNPERLLWIPPAVVIGALAVQLGDVIADIGAGTGYFSLPLAQAAGSLGQVYAVDCQADMLGRLQFKLDTGSISNIRLINADADSTGLPNASCDLVFMANVWHEFADRPAVLREARRILNIRGRIAVLDWRPDVEAVHGRHFITESVLQMPCMICNLQVSLRSSRATPGYTPGSFRDLCNGG